MDSISVLIKLQLIISFFCFFYSITIIQNSTRNSGSRYLGYSEASLGLWYLLSSISKIIDNVETVILIRSLIYIVSEVSVITALLFSIFSTNFTSRKNIFNIKYLLFIPIILLVATIIAFCSDSSIFLEIPPLDQQRFLKAPIEDFLFRKKLPYVLHCGICYTTITCTIICFLRNILKDFKENLRIIALMSAGIIIFILPNFYHVFVYNIKMDRIDTISPILEALSFLCMCTICFFAVNFNSSEKSICCAKIDFFDKTGLPIFILNKNKKLLQINNSALEFLNAYEINLEKFDELSKIFPANKVQILGIPDSPDPENEFYISGIKDKKLFYGKISEIKDENNSVIGYFVSLSKLDFYTGIIKQLEKSAYTDEVTGCKKNTAFIQKISSMLQKKSEQFLVCTALIDNLEGLNERIGLGKTDRYIQTFTDILINSITSLAFSSMSYGNDVEIFRINGSTFGFILPSSAEKIIPLLFKKIRAECTRFSKTKVEPLNCYLGYAVTTGTAQDSEKIVQKSYNNMILDKQNASK